VYQGTAVSLCVCIPLGAVTYLTVALLLRAPEARTILARIVVRVGR
jgi:hypothetical protein